MVLSDGRRSRIWTVHDITLFLQQKNLWKMSFHSDSKANLAHADCNSDPSRNVNFDEDQANTTIVSKKGRLWV